MFVPSVEAVQITILLLDKYKDAERIENALKHDFSFGTPEELLQQHFAQNTYSDELEDVITELFFRVHKYRKFLMMIEKEFLVKNQVLVDEKSSLNLAVLLYFFIIEFNEFSREKIEELVMNINQKRAYLLLTFLKRSDIKSMLFELGIQIWDTEYVKNMLQNSIKSSLFEEAYERIAGLQKRSNKTQKKKLTTPIGPSFLNRIKKKVEKPECVYDEDYSDTQISKIPKKIKTYEIPYTTYTQPDLGRRIEMACKFNREQAQRKYEEAQKHAFRCANIDKSEKIRKLKEEIEKEQLFIPIRKVSSGWVKYKDVKPPKKNAAVILREGARLLKLEQEQIKRYEYLASGGYNSEIIAELEKEIREKMFKENLEEIERKHLEGLLTHEEVVIAKQKCFQKKKERAIEIKKEKENWVNELENWRKEEEMRIQESYEKGKAYEMSSKGVMEQLREEKHKMVLETMEESRALKERWRKEKEEDLQRKVTLIKEIKALQALGALKKKHTDFTETANLGLLYEMSIAELKERLFILKIELQEEIKRKQAEIKMKRECRKDIIDGYRELIESHRKTLQEQSENKEMKKQNKLVSDSASIENLRQKLYEKRRERIKQQIMLNL